MRILREIQWAILFFSLLSIIGCKEAGIEDETADNFKVNTYGSAVYGESEYKGM